MKKTILCLLLTLGLLMLSTAAMADDYIHYSINEGDITITDGANEGTLRIQQGSDVNDHINPGTTILNCSVEELMILENGILNNIGKLSVNAGNLHINKNGILNNQGELIANCTIRNSYNGIKNNGTISSSGQIMPLTKKLPLGKPTSLTVKNIENGTVTLSVPANANATAEYSPDGTNWQDSPVFERVDLSAGQTFYARYKANNFFNASGETSITVYPVSLNANGGTIASGKDVGYYIAGQSTLLPTDVKKENYSFAGWYDNEAFTGDPVLAIGANDTSLKTFWTKWKPDSYTVTLNTNGGTINSGNLTGYTHGVGATLPTDVTREHYTFAGWYDNAIGAGTPFTEISGDATSPKVFWAKWIPDTYNLTLKANGGTILSGNLTSYTYGEVTPLPADMYRLGYTFAGWYDNEACTGDPLFFIEPTEAGDKTLWADWLLFDFSVTLNANGGTINSGNLTGYIFGMGALLPIDVTRAGYTFAGWYDNEALTGDPVTEIANNATGDKTFWAKWRAIITDPAGAIVSGEAFAKLPAVKAPTLVLPDGKTLDASITLRYEKLSTSMENTVVYDIYLVDQDGNRVKLPYACTLCIPYPDGLNQNSQSTYHINILHEMDGGKSEDFDSVSGGLELKQQGLCVQVSSLSPFTITWERLPEADLPQTGDNGHPGLWLALMLASVIALAILLRGRKTA